MATRRFDPDRRNRIVEAAVVVIGERGVAGTSHRAIAKVADVPLGSLTYHFAGLDDLLRHAFERVARRLRARFDAAFDVVGPGDPEGALDAAVRIIRDFTGGAVAEYRVLIELTAHALRHVDFRDIAQDWAARSRRTLVRHFGADAAPAVNALIEGLVLHGQLSTEPFGEEWIRRAIAQAAGDACPETAARHPARPS